MSTSRQALRAGEERAAPEDAHAEPCAEQGAQHSAVGRSLRRACCFLLVAISAGCFTGCGPGADQGGNGVSGSSASGARDGGREAEPALDLEALPFQKEWVGGTLVVNAYYRSITNLNHLNASPTALSAYFRFLLCPPLLSHAADLVDGKPALIAVAAAELPTSEDLLTWHFTLRDDLTWSGAEGRPVTTEDVTYSFEMLRNPQSGNGAKTLGLLLADVEKITVTGPHRFAVTYKSPRSDGGNLFGLNFRLVPAHEMPADPVQFQATRQHASYGPYEIADYREDHLKLTLRPEYRVRKSPFGPAYIESLEFPAPGTNVHLENDLIEGKADVGVVGASRVEAILSNPQYTGRLVHYVLPLYLLMPWNTASRGAGDAPHPVLHDAMTRRALDHLIPREEIARDFYGPYATLCHGPFYPEDPGADPSVQPRVFDPGQAKNALVAAGWSQGEDGRWRRNGVELQFELLCQEGGQFQAIATKIADSARPHGVEIKVDVVPGLKLMSRIAAHDFDAALFFNRVSCPSEETVREILHSEFAVDSGNNWAMLRDPLTDDLLDSIVTAASFEERVGLRRQLTRRVHELAPYAFLNWVPSHVVVHDRWANAQAHRMGLRYSDLVLRSLLESHPPE